MKVLHLVHISARFIVSGYPYIMPRLVYVTEKFWSNAGRKTEDLAQRMSPNKLEGGHTLVIPYWIK